MQGGWFAAALLGIGSFSHAVAAAEVTSEGADESARLFREGRQLVAVGQTAAACEKFAASLALRRSPGTLLNVAQCRAAAGKLVLAIAADDEAVTRAEEQLPGERAQAWVDAGRRDAELLRKRVAQLEVKLPSSEGVTLRVDGQPWTQSGAMPMDPGAHSLEASSPGRVPFRLELELAEGALRQVLVPELAPLPAAPVAAVPVAAVPVAAAPAAAVSAETQGQAPASSGSALGWALVGTGSAALVAGGATGWITAARTRDLKRDCVGHVCPTGFGPLRDAHRFATATDVLVGAGAVTLGAGVAWLLWNRQPPSHAELGVGCLPANGCSIDVRGAF